VKISGAVKVLEKFIRLFYSPHLLNFSTMGDVKRNMGFEKTENTYALFHFLLAGDFFEDHRKYSEFLDSMRNERMVEKFRHLIQYSTDKNAATSCEENFEEMYGKVTAKIQFDLSAFN
jgi:hypothetical protein